MNIIVKPKKVTYSFRGIFFMIFLPVINSVVNPAIAHGANAQNIVPRKKVTSPFPVIGPVLKNLPN